jgi:methyl-accepting chemotaxis protein
VTRTILYPITAAVGFANRISEGDLRDEPIALVGRDEAVALLGAMRTMREQLARALAEVRSGADALGGASENVSATAQMLSQGTTQQAASVEETTASLEKMRDSISLNAENSRARRKPPPRSRPGAPRRAATPFARRYRRCGPSPRRSPSSRRSPTRRTSSH